MESSLIEVPAAKSDGGRAAERPPRAEPAFYRRRKKRRKDQLGQVLLRLGYIHAEQLREALRVQAESGGLVGAILRRIGACDAHCIAEGLIEQARLVRDRGGRFLASAARNNPSLAGLMQRCKPQRVALSLLGGDVCVLLLSAALVFVLERSSASVGWERYSTFFLVPACLLSYALSGLYTVTPPAPPREIRSLTLASFLVYLVLASTTLALQAAWSMGHQLSWVAGLLVTLLFVPVARGILRSRLSRSSWWGRPVVVFGAGKQARRVIASLKSRPELGMRPVAILAEDKSHLGSVRLAWDEGDIDLQPVSGRSEARAAGFDSSARAAFEQFSEVESVPIMGGFELAPVFAQRLGVRSALFALSSKNAAAVHQLIERFADGYNDITVLPDLYDLSHFGAPTRQLDAVLGIEVQRQLLLRWPRFSKRVMDLMSTSVALLLLSPLLLLIALLIKLDSRGPVFYPQTRLGQDGVRFKAFKFRSMYGDGEKRLQEVLSRSPELLAEYQQFHKLSVDPRVTRVGRLLRRYSLDELPQLLNVWKGDMSLVGPRPYLERELGEMVGRELVVLRVKPGITGYWQVMERNASTFDYRVKLDVEYVRSWSPWLDLYVIARTIPVVLGGTGS